MKLEVTIEKRYVALIVVALFFVAGGFFAYAYGTSTPSTFGHSFGEIEGVQARIASGLTQCSGANLAIKTIDPATGAVTCETDDTGPGGSTSGTVLGGRSYTCSSANPIFWGTASLAGCGAGSTLRTTGTIFCDNGTPACSFAGGCTLTFSICVKD